MRVMFHTFTLNGNLNSSRLRLQPFQRSSYNRIIQFYAFLFVKTRKCQSRNLYVLSACISGNKYVQEVFENVYKVAMKLTIVDVNIDDFGTYKCMAKNSLGETDGSIKLYREYFFSLSLFICTNFSILT